MVDAATSTAERIAVEGATLSPEIGISVEVTCGASAVERYRRFSADSIHGPAQSGDWVAGWAENHGADIAVAEVSLDGKPVLALALEIVRHGRLVEARYPGGRHANGNFAAVAEAWTGALPGIIADLTAGAFTAARPDIDLLRLERQQPEIAGIANPLIVAASTESPNIALAADLAGGFDAYLSRHSGKRKRKKHRSDGRKFVDQGGYRTFVARSPEESDALLDAFFVMKAKRFREMGISDVFADARTKAFFKQLFSKHAGEAGPAYVVQALEIGGIVRAVTGSSICGDCVVCEFSGFIEDESLNTSPGDFLFFENIAWSCDNGFAVFDFSVGDEYYKRQWCDIETVQYDTLLPLTAKGRIAATGLEIFAAAKRKLKSSPRLWAAAKTLRRTL